MLNRIETQKEIFLGIDNSSWLRSMVYDKDYRTLMVTGFDQHKNKPILYAYKNVPTSLWREYEKSVAEGNSAGRMFNQMIKPHCTLANRPI
jgi:hypothetical protein